MAKYIQSHEEYSVTPLTISPNHNGWPAKILIKELGGIKAGERTFGIHQNKGLKYFASEEAWQKASNYVIYKFKTDFSLIKRVEKISEKISRQILKIIYPVTQANIAKWSNYQIANYLLKSYKLANDFCAYGYVPLISDHLFLKFTHLLKGIVRNSLIKHGLTGSAPEVMQLLSSPLKPIPSRLARQNLLKLALSVKHEVVGEKEMSKINNYYRHWFWVNNGQLGPELMIDEVVNDLQELVKNKTEIRKQLLNLQNEYKLLKKRQDAWYNKLKLNKIDKQLFNTAQITTYLKGLRMEVLFGIYASWGRVLTEMSNRLSAPKDLLYYCSINELADWLNKNKKVSISVLRERQKFCVWVAVAENKQIILTGKKAHQYIKLHAKPVKKVKHEVLVIHGSVASLGYAKGHVKIVNTASQINKVKIGDILVSVATNPSLLPAMQKAAAFVTDSGGITSHAAIVAREMKKPCLIGTKIATQVLKDGDLIEVDTRKGDVRKVGK